MTVMRLGIVSDTHDQIARTRLAVALLLEAGAEALAHCGDVTGPDVVALFAARPSYFTFGNHDSDKVPALGQAIEAAGGVCLGWGGEAALAGKRVALAHGHMHVDVRRLMAARPDYLLSGHSHVAADRREGPTRRINPGALAEAEAFSVALLDLATDELRFISVPR
jgi:putative phosphoesterase